MGSGVTRIWGFRFHLRVLDLDSCQLLLEQTQKHPSRQIYFNFFPLIVTQFRIARGLKSIFHRFRNRPHVGIWTAIHVSMRLVLVSDSSIPKGSWELLWLVQAHRPVFPSVKLAPIKCEKSFVPRHMKSDEGLFWKSNRGNVVCNTHIREDSWINTQYGVLRREPEPEPFKVHSSRWGVIPIFDSWWKQHLRVQTIRRVEMYSCKIVTNSKIKRTCNHSNRRFNNMKWANDKGRFVYHVHLSHHRGAKSWFQSRVTSQK